MYPFFDFDVPSMLEDLLQKKVIKLSECKRLEEMGCINDPNNFHYHRIVNHPMEKCFILKDLIMKLAKQGRIHLDLDEVVESNHATITFRSLNPILLHVPPKTLGACADTIQCESPKPKQTQVSCQDIVHHFYFDNESMSYNEECWTLVTRRRPHKKQESHPYPNLPRKEQCKQNIHRYVKKKEEKKPKRKQAIV